jgi:hypothetical protein
MTLSPQHPEQCPGKDPPVVAFELHAIAEPRWLQPHKGNIALTLFSAACHFLVIDRTLLVTELTESDIAKDRASILVVKLKQMYVLVKRGLQLFTGI